MVRASSVRSGQSATVRRPAVADAGRRRSILPVVEQHDVEHVAEAIALVDRGERAARPGGGRQRQVLVVGLIGGRPHLHELRGIARRVRAVVGIVVGDLVVVPDREPGEGGMGGLQVGIELVERVAVAELGQASSGCRPRDGAPAWNPRTSRRCSRRDARRDRGRGSPCRDRRRSSPARTAGRRRRRSGTAMACCSRLAPCACGRSGSRRCRRGSDTSSAGRAAGPWPRRARHGPAPATPPRCPGRRAARTSRPRRSASRPRPGCPACRRLPAAAAPGASTARRCPRAGCPRRRRA